MTARERVLQRFGKRLRALRNARGLTQEGLAERAGIHENFVSRLETGNQEPGLIIILRLCKALKSTPNELLQDSAK